MAFQSSGKSSRAVMSEINVTPLVDVMLVLLIMFMVTAPLLQQGVAVELPKTSASGLPLREEPFVLSIDAKQKVQVAGETLEVSRLGEKLKSIFRNRKNQQIFLQADRKIPYGVVAEAIAEIRAAGLTQLGLVTLPKDL
ncbi:MAG: biopolymer transporter ExbD [Bdellovibrio sp.]